MKKVLIFSLAYYPFVGGAEVAVKEITDRFHDCEFEMITCALTSGLPRFERVGNVSVYRVGGGKLFFPFLAFIKARQLHKKNGYNLIWSIMANRAGFAALFFKHHFPKVPFVLTLQEGDPLEDIKRKVRFIYPLFKRIFTRADWVTTISSYLADWARDMGAQAPVTIVPNGVDMGKFKSQKLKVKSNGEEKIVITTSRLVEKNGVGDLIEAMRYLPDNVTLWIIGSGPLEEELKMQITKLKIENRVKMFGFMSHDKMLEYLKQADVFVRPSLSEGLGNSFLEAMAVGLPIVGTPVGGIPDFLKDGETGLFCRPRDPKDIAKKVQRIIEDDTVGKSLVLRARELIECQFSWEIIAEKMSGIFNRFLCIT